MTEKPRTRRRVNLAMTTAKMVRTEGEKLTPEDVLFDEIDDIELAMALWRDAQTTLAAAKDVARVSSEVVARILGEGGAFGYGDSVVRHSKSSSEKCIDPRGFVEYVTLRIRDDGIRHLDLGDVLNPNDAKVGWMDEAVRTTFFEKTFGDSRLAIVPRSRAPKFLVDLGDGEVFVSPVEEPTV